MNNTFHELLACLLDTIDASYLLLDHERQIQFANRSAIDRFGQHLLHQDIVHYIRHPSCLEAIGAALKGEKNQKISTQFHTPTTEYLELTVKNILHPNHQQYVVAVILEDVSLLYDAEKIRHDFVSNVSHELRSPLTSLAGFIETLKTSARDDPEARDHFLDLMSLETDRMTRLVSDLLSLSKVQENERFYPDGVVDISVIIQRIMASVALELEREKKQIFLRQQASSYCVRGHEDELHQVYLNLIENAIKYGAKGTDITVEICDGLALPDIEGPSLQVIINDCGMGIDAEDIPRLTERFYRIDRSRSRNKGGTGLGLAIVKHVVNRHRGLLQIESRKGIGSRFSVMLPKTNQKTDSSSNSI